MSEIREDEHGRRVMTPEQIRDRVELNAANTAPRLALRAAHERPEPGVRWFLYPPATFYPCPTGRHYEAQALTVFEVTETGATAHSAVCAECGTSLFREE